MDKTTRARPRGLLGNQLLAARKLRGETIRQVAAAVGVNHATYSRIERGIYACNDRLKLALSAHFHIPLDRLFFRPDVVSRSHQEDDDA